MDILPGGCAANALGMPWNSALFLGGALDGHQRVLIFSQNMMDRWKEFVTRASVILGAAVIDDVRGLCVLAFLRHPQQLGQQFLRLAAGSNWLRLATQTQGRTIPDWVKCRSSQVCRGNLLWVSYGAAKGVGSDPTLILQLRRLRQ